MINLILKKQKQKQKPMRRMGIYRRPWLTEAVAIEQQTLAEAPCSYSQRETCNLGTILV